jgi:hypothetical protein
MHHKQVLGVLQITWEFGFLGRVVLKLTLQTMAGILSNLFEVSFYAFTVTNNYSLFTLWFKPLFFVF